jgi:predicted membrane protein
MDTDRWEEKQQRWEQRRQERQTRWEARMARRRAYPGTGGFFAGAIVAAIGLLLLLDNLGIVRFHDIWQYWPVLLIVWGVSHILSSRNAFSYAWGGVIALIGALFLLNNLDIVFFNFHLIWPLIIIAVGVGMLLHAFERQHYGMAGGPPSSDPMAEGFAIFGNTKRRVDSQDFRGGKASSVFGEVIFDLRSATMVVDEAVIDLDVVFGAVKIFVPQTWLVQVKAVTVFGGVEDKTLPPRPDPNVKTPHLIVAGNVVFGGISLYN